MYDAREKALRDQQWAVTASRNEGRVEGKVEGEIEGEKKLIRTLQEILMIPISDESELQGKTFDELQQLTAQLQEKLRNRKA